MEARHSPEVEARGSKPRWHEPFTPLESSDSSGFCVVRVVNCLVLIGSNKPPVPLENERKDDLQGSVTLPVPLANGRKDGLPGVIRNIVHGPGLVECACRFHSCRSQLRKKRCAAENAAGGAVAEGAPLKMLLAAQLQKERR